MSGKTNITREQFAQLASLWAETCPHLQAFVHSMVNNHEDAEDIVQQVAVVVSERFDTYDQARPFKHWAIGIARNVVLEYFKRNKKQHVIFIDSLSMEKYGEFYEERFDPQAELMPKLKHCMARLTKRSRHLLELRYVRSLTPKQIAHRLDTTANTVRVALFRIRVALRDCMAQSTTATESEST